MIVVDEVFCVAACSLNRCGNEFDWLFFDRYKRSKSLTLCTFFFNCGVLKYYYFRKISLMTSGFKIFVWYKFLDYF
jgi:hypothetical protein